MSTPALDGAGWAVLLIRPAELVGRHRQGHRLLRLRSRQPPSARPRWLSASRRRPTGQVFNWTPGLVWSARTQPAARRCSCSTPRPTPSVQGGLHPSATATRTAWRAGRAGGFHAQGRAWSAPPRVSNPSGCWLIQTRFSIAKSDANTPFGGWKLPGRLYQILGSGRRRLVVYIPNRTILATDGTPELSTATA